MTIHGDHPAEALGEPLYRPCVGIVVFNRAGLVWAGHRVSRTIRDPEGQERWWQMPQGGVLADEDERAAALRELEEETAIRTVRVLGISAGRHRYDFPARLVEVQRGLAYRGQVQRWIATGFEGEDAEIDIAGPAGAMPEFTEWAWLPIDDLPGRVAPFKRKVYTEVLAEFAHLRSWADGARPVEIHDPDGK